MASSFLEPYGKIDDADQARLDARRKTRKRVLVIALSSLLLLTIILASVLGTRSNNSNHHDIQNDAAAMKSVAAVCGVTLYKDSCYQTLSSAAKSGHLHPEDLFKLSVQVAIGAVEKASDYFSKTSKNYDNATAAAVADCVELLDLAADHLNDTYSSSSSGPTNVADVVDDVRTWLSSAATYQDTCLDGLRETGVVDGDVAGMRNATELTSNSLAIVTWMGKVAGSLGRRRRLLGHGPEWVYGRAGYYRELLAEKGEDLKKNADAVVGNGGKYKTIEKALKAVPKKSKERFVIYVKKGVYKENVKVEKTMWNVVMVGDGMDATVVTGGLNVVDGTPTFGTATFAVFGKGFMARDMGFKNTAGPTKHQAVALMSNADQSIFYRCSFDAYQDTLYAHANRQFYRECNITGTVDFIFGNSAAVIQNSNILPRVPMPGQINTITAQGKTDPNQNTGIAIQNCRILPYKGDAKGVSAVKNYLGRPWKAYSTTAFVGSEIGGLIDPQGWLAWTGTTAPPTIYYAEYGNFGAGADTKKRVKWKGVKFMNKKEAERFSVKAFIQGDKWIPASGATYN
ncbi:unnamed protein product [Linum trigynum]|uniref:Pectinesterase n=1 Tax=Linum trigynum TaxID=586398 RepID=A0AAV2DLC7_9ROSI